MNLQLLLEWFRLCFSPLLFLASLKMAAVDAPAVAAPAGIAENAPADDVVEDCPQLLLW